MHLTPQHISALLAQGCTASDWTTVFVADDFDPTRVTHTAFIGTVHLGSNLGDIELTPGFSKPCGIHDATLCDVSIGDHCLIENVRGYIRACRIDNDCCISDVYSIETTASPSFGEGSLIPILNEAGSGNVMLSAALTSQWADLMIRYEHDSEFTSAIRRIIRQDIDQRSAASPCTTIQHHTRILNTQRIVDCRVAPYSRIVGAQLLEQSTLCSSAEAPVSIGDGVILSDCVVATASSVSRYARLRGCFVGESSVITEGFTAENSLFFANTYMANGEACAAFCGPFSASHHKSTLLIGTALSFYNAGSNTNFSNHAYKMGPIHYGTLARGTKTASGSHILLPAQIGAFSVCLGKLTNHPDTRLLPFSYIIAEGNDTWIVPGRNLTTVGLYRDIRKWPQRDKRPLSARRSFIGFDWLSPYTIHAVVQGRLLLQQLLSEQGDTDTYRYGSCRIRRSSLLKGIDLYTLAMRLYMGSVLQHAPLSAPTPSAPAEPWSDLAGLLIPVSEEQRLVSDVRTGRISSADLLHTRFKRLYSLYPRFQWAFAYRLICDFYGLSYWDDTTAKMVLNDYQGTRRTWLEAIQNDAHREWSLGDVADETYHDFITNCLTTDI